MTMATGVEAIRREIAGLSEHKNSRRYSAELRARVVAWTRPWVARGRSIPALCNELGMGEPTLRRFLEVSDAPVRNVGFKRVRVVQQSKPLAEPRAVVRGPCGTSVEGLSIDGIAELLRRLSCSA
jgi:hypothetical protein